MAYIVKGVDLTKLSVDFTTKTFFARTPSTLSSDIHKPYRANRNKILQTSIHIFSNHHNSL